MKLFRKKDKRKDNDSSSFGLPGFEGGTGMGKKGRSDGNDYRQNGRQPFGSPPLGTYGGSSAHSQHYLNNFRPMATHASALAIANLPAPILERIFGFVCPHTRDESYETCEQSSIEDACMLCDLRDLAHCVQVNRRWKREARKLL